MTSNYKDASAVSSPKILVTNDDGINAPGIAALASAMADLGEVFVVAPASEQSGVSQAITISDPIKVRKIYKDDTFFGWSVGGTPSDCVKVAVKGLFDFTPDLVVSGINQGNNSACNILYSGTVAGAIEGAIQGIPGIAFSLSSFEYRNFSAAAQIATIVASQVLTNGLPPDTILNVNVPALPIDKIRGIQVTRQGTGRFVEDFDHRHDPLQRPYFWLKGERAYLDSDADVDDVALANSFASVTPLQLNLTATKLLAELESWDLKIKNFPNE